MIEAEVYRGDVILMKRTFYGNDLTLEFVIGQLESYVKREQLNIDGECLLRARYGNDQAVK